MKYLNLFLERSLVFFFVFCFTLVALYTPQPYNEVPEVEAGALFDLSTLSHQVIEEVTRLKILSESTITSTMTTNSFVLDNAIDGVAWAAAKNVLSQLTSSMVEWVNSGYNGDPVFVTNLEGFLLETGDKAHEEYLDDLTGSNSNLCEPFKLDVATAVEKTYIASRENASGALPAPRSCVLSGPVEHLGEFIDGSQTFSDAGGWDTWFAVTNNPTKYTPFGSYQASVLEDAAKVAEAERNETKLLDFGQGFLSSKICESADSLGGKKQNCTITTPGKTINEALSFNLASGQRSLEHADEINELVSGFFQRALIEGVTGAAGLLGLSGGTGYTYSGTPYTSKLLEPIDPPDSSNPSNPYNNAGNGDDNFQIIDPPPFSDS